MGQMISFQRPDGQHVDGYLAEPASGASAPGVVVIQEWWGLNDQIKGVADRLAAAGYRALVPDLYRGKVALAANEAEHLMNDLNFGDAAGQDVRGAVQHLKATGSAKVGVSGYCMPPRSRRLHHNAYRCRDSEATRAFYEGLSRPAAGLLRCTLEIRPNPERPRHRTTLHTFYRLGDGSFLAFFEAPDMPFDFKPQHDFDLHIALEVDRPVLDHAMFAKGRAPPRASRPAACPTTASSTRSTSATRTAM
jgi:dienelactone hydrolase